jgi:uncharacterized membrane protein YkoI
MKKVLLTTGLSLALLAGGALAAQAAGLPVAKADTATSTVAVIEKADPTEVNGTEVADATEVNGTEVPDTTEVKGTEVDDATEAADKEVDPAVEQAQLQAQAKITAEQSKAAALKQVSGTVQSVILEDEDNTAVYTVTVKDSAGKLQDVKVNAQTGAIVKVESSDGETQDNESDTETAD